MLDFSFIPDEKNMHARDLAYAGGIEYEEFEKARKLKIEAEDNRKSPRLLWQVLLVESANTAKACVADACCHSGYP